MRTDINPGYTRTEVGVIPQDWRLVRAANVVEPSAPICYGVVQVGRHIDDGIPIVPIKFVKEIAWAPLHRMSSLLEKPYVRSRVKAGDVLISIKGTIGRVGVVPQGFDGNISRELARLRPRQEYSGEYVAYQLEADSTQGRISKATVGTTRLEFSIATLRQFELPIPSSLMEQRAIAEVIGDVDALLTGLDRLIAKKRDLKQAAMQQLLTGQTRLPGFDGPWKAAELNLLCSMKSGESITSEHIDQSSTYPCYGGNGIRGFTSRFTHEGSYVLIGRQGALCGNVVVANGRFFASEHAVVVSARAAVNVRWLAHVLKRMNLNQYSESSAQPGLSVSKILKLSVGCPPTEAEQSAIAAVLADMDDELGVLETRLNKTRALKQAMMQELLTGRIRLI